MASTITTSVVTGGSNNHATVSEEANAYATDFVTQGVVGTIGNTNGAAPTTGSFGVNQDASPDMGVLVNLGVAYVLATPSSQNSQVLRARMTANYTTYAISANASGSTKYDWVYLKTDPTNANTPASAADNVTNLFTSRSTSNVTDNGTPPTYGILLAVVTVANGASSITNANIADRRSGVTLGNGTTAASNGWNTLNYALSYSVAYGNRSFDLTTTGDVTGTLSPGMRLSVARAVSPPTQCTNLNGTTQFWNRASASLSGITWTNNFAASAWVKVSSYSSASIISRYNGTSGWDLRLTGNGQVDLIAYNAGSGNTSDVSSSQTIPLNKWVHIAAQLDMASFTVTPTTSYIMIDGVDVPATVARTGTNPTALVQAGNLEVGSRNGGTQFFPGKIAQVAVYSAKVTEATIRVAMNQTMAGSETSLAAFYSFNGNSGVDATSNANNLTAQASSTDTTVDSPFNSTEYAIIEKVSYSNPTSTITIQTPNTGVVPNQTLNTPQYSYQKVPFGFPSQRNRWTLELINLAGASQGSPTVGTWYNTGSKVLYISIGEWVTTYNVSPQLTGASGSGSLISTTLSTANNTENDITYTTSTYGNLGSGTLTVGSPMTKTRAITLTVQTPYYLNYKTGIASSGTLISDSTPGIISAENAYL